jgi:hypothetical protein
MLWFKSRRLIRFVFLTGRKAQEAVGESFPYQFLTLKAHPENSSEDSNPMAQLEWLNQSLISLAKVLEHD